MQARILHGVNMYIRMYNEELCTTCTCDIDRTKRILPPSLSLLFFSPPIEKHERERGCICMRSKLIKYNLWTNLNATGYERAHLHRIYVGQSYSLRSHYRRPSKRINFSSHVISCIENDHTGAICNQLVISNFVWFPLLFPFICNFVSLLETYLVLS